MESNDRPRSRGSNREEADMAISDVEQVRTIIFFTIRQAVDSFLKKNLSEYLKFV